METPAQPITRVLEVVKNNILLISISSLGVILLGIGMIQLMQKEDQKIVFEDESEVLSEKSEATIFMVDVSGEVTNPGVYEMQATSRVQDALVAAGGLTQNADRTYISQYVNLAQPLTDGMKLYFPKVGALPPQSSAAGSSVAGLININTAGEAELDTLAGVGPVTAQKIIDGRPYASIEELQSRKIVNSSTFEKIKNSISTF